MNKEQLIVKQQLEIESLKERLQQKTQRIDDVHGILYCIGGPLNDNQLRFTPAQKGVFARISVTLRL